MAVLRQAVGAVDVFVHGLLVERDDSSRTQHARGAGAIDYLPDWSFARPCRMLLEDQAEADTAHNVSGVAAQFEQQAFGFSPATSMNFARAYFSMSRVAELVRAQEEERARRGGGGGGGRAVVHGQQAGVGASSSEYSHVVLARADTGLLAPLQWRALPAGTVAVPNFRAPDLPRFEAPQPSEPLRLLLQR